MVDSALPVTAAVTPVPAADWSRRRLLTAAAVAPAVMALPARRAVATEVRSLSNATDDATRQLLDHDDARILVYASFAPSGHNTQPWTVKIVERGHWRIGTDKQRWLPAVDPANRETTLSVGAFLQNLIVAAEHVGYAVEYRVIANAATDTELVELHLRKAAAIEHAIGRLATRRTVRRGYGNEILKAEDQKAIVGSASDCFYFARDTKPAQFLAEATIDANRKQAYREPAQEELANWIRWTKKDRERHRNGLTPAGMEITGVAGWYVSTFYDRDDVMKRDFRETGIQQVVERVGQGAGWLVMTGPSSVAGLIETGRRFERMWLALRERSIAIHPMTQILEEAPRADDVARLLGIDGTPQFVLRVGYVKDYPEPVSPRMPVAWFTRKG